MVLIKEAGLDETLEYTTLMSAAVFKCQNRI
jgi:hypothetical protein